MGTKPNPPIQPDPNNPSPFPPTPPPQPAAAETADIAIPDHTQDAPDENTEL